MPLFFIEILILFTIQIYLGYVQLFTNVRLNIIIKAEINNIISIALKPLIILINNRFTIDKFSVTIF
jgi:hypothetical protein